MFDKWVWKMAWRDSQGSRKRLLLFLSSMVVGVAALVAINSFGYNLERAIDQEANTIFGADMSLERDAPFVPETEALIDSLGGEQSRMISFPSMAFFPKSRKTKLATIRAQDGNYPFYGEVETDPPGAVYSYLDGRQALVDRALMQEFGVVPGDSVRVGNLTYEIAGALLKTPRESAVMMLFSPRIYIPVAHLDTSLVGFGSRVEYEVYFRFEPEREVDTEALREELEAHREAYDIGMDTIEESREEWDFALGNLQRFLSLVGLIALLLGGVGVGSAIHVYVKQRLETVALLRCLGATSARTLWIYLVQAIALGTLGGIAGCLLGIAVQFVVPSVLGDFLPLDIDIGFSASAAFLGFSVGLAATLLFALLPLLTVRNVSPLRAIRSAFEEKKKARDPYRWLVFVLLACGIGTFAVIQAQNFLVGILYAAALSIVFGLLFLVARGLMLLSRALMPPSWRYTWRQGLANLYRPGNQTLLMMLAVGLSTFLIMVLILVEGTLVTRISGASGEDRPDMVLFDVQPHQLVGVSRVVEDKGFSVMHQSPIVTMRIHSVGETLIDSMRADSTADRSWAHTREYRSTYQATLTEAERVVEGTFEGVHTDNGGWVPVSIEKELAENELGVTLGDTIVFDVQGSLVHTRVSSIREVDWQRMQTNFFFVFPTGVLETAPQNHVIMTRAETESAVGILQAAVVEAYPNVSVISLSQILGIVDALFGRISFAIRFMALFSILTGILVLIGSVMISKYQRTAESVLLKTLGASRKQVFEIMLVEYLFLGVLSTLTGLVLAYASGWCLAAFVFDVPFVVAPLALVITVVGVTGLIIAIGLFNSRGVYSRPALEVLRTQV